MTASQVDTDPLTVAYGMGVDSTAILVGLHQRGERPDLITFADTGSEKQVTMDYLPVINRWLTSVGFPQVTVIQYRPKKFKHWPPYKTLFENCLSNSTLPSISFGFHKHSCSLKWKVQPQLQWIKQWGPAQEAWKAGRKVVRCVGYDCTETHRLKKASARHQLPTKEEERFQTRYPLIEWGWTRDDCIAAIQSADLPVPPKSACFFCAASKPRELHDLNREELSKIVVMERRAADKCHTIGGLWCREVKGTRGATPHPAAMTDYIRAQCLLPGQEIDRLQNGTPTHTLDSSEISDWGHFTASLLNERTEVAS